MYDEIKKNIKEIVSICNEIPEEYRTKCFELLIQPLLNPIPTINPSKGIEDNKLKPEAQKESGKNFRMPFEVRAFLTQYNVPEEKILQLFFIEDGSIKPIYELKTVKKTAGQIQLSLLKALENALNGGKYEFSVEVVRQACIDHTCYDPVNFSTYFKKRENLFKSLSDLEHVELAPSGKQLLSETIFEIAK